MPYTRPTTIAATLTAAADYIERCGWHRGYLYDDHNRCTRNCLAHRTGRYPASILGVVRAALVGQAKWFMETTPAGTNEAYAATVDHLNRHLIDRGAFGLRAPALMWQAAPGRTAAQVAAALRVAASTAPAAGFDALGLAPVVDLDAHRAGRRPAA